MSQRKKTTENHREKSKCTQPQKKKKQGCAKSTPLPHRFADNDHEVVHVFLTNLIRKASEKKIEGKHTHTQRIVEHQVKTVSD